MTEYINWDFQGKLCFGKLQLADLYYWVLKPLHNSSTSGDRSGVTDP